VPLLSGVNYYIVILREKVGGTVLVDLENNSCFANLLNLI
jgi:hypothetical protein